MIMLIEVSIKYIYVFIDYVFCVYVIKCLMVLMLVYMVDEFMIV